MAEKTCLCGFNPADVESSKNKILPFDKGTGFGGCLRIQDGLLPLSPELSKAILWHHILRNFMQDVIFIRSGKTNIL